MDLIYTSTPIRKEEQMKKFLVVMAAMLMLMSTVAMADTFTFTTAAGAKESGGNNVSATATVTTNDNGTITVVLNNLIVNPTTVAQNISDFAFTLSTGQTTGSISSSSGATRSVADSGTYTTGGPVSTGWGGGAGLHFTALGFSGPAFTILGQPGAGNLYSAAGGSIAGNGPHNPFLYGPVTFTLAVAGVTHLSQVTSFTFSFGTTAGNDVPGGGQTPEPASMFLLGTGLVGIGGAIRRKIRL